MTTVSELTTTKRKHPLALCESCPLYEKPVAFSDGPEGAKLAVVSRSPGHYEAVNGKVFSGPSGRVLDHLLSLHGADRKTTFTTNVVLCQTDEPPGAAIEACRPRLESEICHAETIIAAGREAAYVLVGETNISTNRGFVHHRTSSAGNKQRVIITNNPAVVLRDDGNLPELVRDFRLAISPRSAPTLPVVRWTDDIEEAKRWVSTILDSLEHGSIIATDIEARGTNGHTGLEHDAEVVCAGFATRVERAVVFGEKCCSDRTFFHDYLKRLWELDSVEYLWHNGKYDCKILRYHGINARVDQDTLLLSWALDERPGNPESGAGGHSLEWLLKDELAWPKYESQSVKEFKKTGILNKPNELYEYNGFDTAGSRGLYEVLRDRAMGDNVWERPYSFLLVGLSEALTTVELKGVLHDDVAACNILEAEVYPKLGEYQRSARQLVDKPKLNLNSPQQLSKLFYDEWKIAHGVRRPKIEGKGKKSTDKDVREALIAGLFSCDQTIVHPERVKLFAKTLDDFKKLDKQRSTYLEGMVLNRWSNGHIYTDYKIHGAESGRLSSSRPNLQNITRPKEGLPNIRRTFLPEPGCVFISADYSQAELRTIAMLSGDKELQAIYLDTNRSLHKEVATQFYGANYTYEQYVRAKNINFSVVYWISAESLYQFYKVPREEAQKFIDFWWSRFPDIWEWTQETAQKVWTEGEVVSPFGHKRRFYVVPADKGGRDHIAKEGINFVPQNIAANLTNWSIIQLVKQGIDVRLTTHDSIVVNARPNEVNDQIKVIKQVMESAPKEALDWDFPFLSEFSTGHTWGDLEEINV